MAKLVETREPSGTASGVPSSRAASSRLRQKDPGLGPLARPALRRAAGRDARRFLLRSRTAALSPSQLAKRLGDVAFGLGDEVVVVLVERQADAVDLRAAPAVKRNDHEAVARETSASDDRVPVRRDDDVAVQHEAAGTHFGELAGLAWRQADNIAVLLEQRMGNSAG